MTIGTTDPRGDGAFTPLEDGATVALTAGAQGGQHIWIALRASGIDPTRPTVQIRLFRASDDLLIGANTFNGASWLEVPGLSTRTYASLPMTAQIYAHRFCDIVHGGSVRLEVHLDDRAGHTFDGPVTVTVDGWTATSDPTLVLQRNQCCADYTNVLCWPDGPPRDAGSPDASTTD